MIEFLRNVSSKLQMLLLIVPDGDVRRAIDQNVRGHKRGIGEKAYGRVFAVLAGLFLELGHSVEPAHPGYAIENPSQFSVFRYLALVEDDMPVGIDSACDKGGRDLSRVSA